MNALDWVLLAIVVLLAIRCFVRGFVRELLSVASWGAGLVAALLLYKAAGAFLKKNLGLSTAEEVVGFALVFLLVFTMVKILERLLSEGLEAANLERADRGLGLLLGLVEGFVAVSIILIVLDMQPVINVDKLLEGSIFARAILPIIAPGLAKALGGQGLPKPGLAPPVKP